MRHPLQINFQGGFGFGRSGCGWKTDLPVGAADWTVWGVGDWVKDCAGFAAGARRDTWVRPRIQDLASVFVRYRWPDF